MPCQCCWNLMLLCTFIIKKMSHEDCGTAIASCHPNMHPLWDLGAWLRPHHEAIIVLLNQCALLVMSTTCNAYSCLPDEYKILRGKAQSWQGFWWSGQISNTHNVFVGMFGWLDWHFSRKALRQSLPNGYLINFLGKVNVFCLKLLQCACMPL